VNFIMDFWNLQQIGKVRGVAKCGGVNTPSHSSQTQQMPVWKVCIARRISPARNFDAFYILITIKFLKSPARNFQTFQSGANVCLTLGKLFVWK
jgi:hypothetical protein